MTGKPRLVVAVANGITGDSRVQKSAIAAARDGWEVFLIGAASGKRTQRTVMGRIVVIRVPVPTTNRDRAGLITGFRLRSAAAVARYQATYHRRQAYGQAVAKRLKPVKPVIGLGLRVHNLYYRARMKAFGLGKKRSKVTGDWRLDLPVLPDFDLAFVPLIEELKPDLVHANDITMIGSAAQAVSRMRSRGEQVRWIYDAHEYVRGVDWPTPATMSAYPALEAEFINEADAVVTVSPEIAEIIKDHYRLDKLPTVVRNTPLRETPSNDKPLPSVRTAAGLPDDVPLLVYSGWISAERGLPTVITAMPQLPGCHFAIVAGRSTPVLDTLLQLSDQLGVRDRVHVVPYVPQHLVPAYLSTADLGIICSKRSLNYENSLPTKLAEYIHGRLPVIVNDLKALSKFVRENDIGEVFSEEAGDFVETVQRGLKRRHELAANISEPILHDLSWEHQSEILVGVYRDTALVTPPSTDRSVPWSVEETAVEMPLPAPAALGKWRPLGSTDVRLGLGPANFAGQAAAFAQAICRDKPWVSAEVTMRRLSTTKDFPADVFLDEARLYGLSVQLEQIKRVLGRYTHLIADGFLPIFGSLHGNSIQGDLPLLKQAGIKVALLAHGSDVRDPGNHMNRHPSSIFRDAPDGIVETLTAKAARNRLTAEQSGLPLFVTTPDLLDDLPGARWAPLVVDVDVWASAHPVMERQRPVVLHVPSARWTKGTDRILPLLSDLDNRGVIDLQLVENVDRATLRQLVQTADIVLDQFGSGSYGAAAVEAMAAGRPVVAYVGERITSPIVNATPETLGEALTMLLDDRDRARSIGEQSVAYAREHHDGRRTAIVFDDFLAS